MAKKKKEREPLLRSNYEIHLEDFSDHECREWLEAMFYYKREWRLLENISSWVKATIRQQITERENDKEEYQKVCDRNREKVMKRWNKEDIQNDTTVYHSIPSNTTDTNSNSNINSIIIDNNTNNKEKKIIKEKKTLPTPLELVGVYEGNDLLVRKINDREAVMLRAEYKQGKRDRAYKTTTWFIQQLVWAVKKIENWLPRADVWERLKFAVNIASEKEWKDIYWTEQIEEEYKSFRRFNSLQWTNKHSNE